MKHLLITIISILLLSSPVIGEETGECIGCVSEVITKKVIDTHTPVVKVPSHTHQIKIMTKPKIMLT